MSENDSRLKIIDRDTIKYIIVFFMFWGHLAAWHTLMSCPGISTPYEVMPLWQNILSHLSLMCPPVMFFFIADGWKYTRDRRKYALRLLIFACITQIPDWLVFQPIYGWWTSNVIFTLFFGLLAITAWESDKKKSMRILLVILCTAATLMIYSDWMIFGVIFILFLHIYRDRPKARLISFIAVSAAWKGTEIIFELCEKKLTAAAAANAAADFAAVMTGYLLMTVFYNGKKGKHPVFSKWFFYAFYPLHYLIILGIHHLL